MQLLELMFQNCLCHAAQCINCFVYTCARVFGCYAQYASLVVWHMFLQLCSCNAFRLFLMSQAGSDKPVQNKGVMLAHSAHHSEASHCNKGNKIGWIRTSSWIKWSADMWTSCQWAWAGWEIAVCKSAGLHNKIVTRCVIWCDSSSVFPAAVCNTHTYILTGCYLKNVTFATMCCIACRP